jgi:hypothetical protein
MKTYGGSGCIDPHFLDLGISLGEWSASSPFRFYHRERARGTHFIGGWVDPRAGLDDMDKSTLFYPTGTRTPVPPGPPARSQSLYRLIYLGSYTYQYEGINVKLSLCLIYYHHTMKTCRGVEF